MANSITPETRESVTRDYVFGVEVEQILKDYGISQSSFYSIIRDAKDKLGKNSIEAMRNIISMIKEQNYPPRLILEATRIASFLESLDSLKQENLLSCLAKLVGHSADEVYGAVSGIVKLSQNYPQENLSSLPNKLEEKIQQKTQLEEQIELDKAEAKKQSKQKEEVLKDAKTTEVEISNFVKAREYLGKNGCNVSNLDSLVKMIKECKRLGYDPSKTVESLQKESFLEKRVQELSKGYTFLPDI